MSRKYKFHNKEGSYFISFAVVNWIDVFTREIYFSCIIDSLEYCRKNKGLELFGYVIMPNHMHMIFRSKKGQPSELLRDFKGFTARELLKLIQGNPKESRKNWMLQSFKEAGTKNSNVKNMQFWQQHNQPIECYSAEIFEQKLNYIHKNPVKAGFVKQPEEWKYSSASNYSETGENAIDLDI